VDRLPIERQELLRKSSTERLRVKLMQEGFDEDKVMAMDRPELLEAMITAMLSAKMAKAAATPSADDDARS